MKRWLSMLLALCMVWSMLIPAALAEAVPATDTEMEAILETDSEMEEAAEIVFTENDMEEAEEIVFTENDMEAVELISEEADAEEAAELAGSFSYAVPGGVILFDPSNGTITGHSGELTNVTIPSKIYDVAVTQIGYEAFWGCGSLISVTIPSSVTSISVSAFNSCSSLTSVTIPNSVTSIGYDAFYNCSSLTNVYYTGTVAEWGKVSIGSSNSRLTNANFHFGVTLTPTAPQLINATASYNAITVNWNAVFGVSRYRVYRKTASTSWQTLANTTATSYTDTSAAKGIAYTYTIRCLSDDGKTLISSYNKKGVTATIPAVTPAAPKLIGTVANNVVIIVAWNGVSNVNHYRVYRKTASTGWKVLDDTSETFYIDTSAVKGTTYYYTVRCLSDDGLSLISSYDAKGVSGVRK